MDHLPAARSAKRPKTPVSEVGASVTDLLSGIRSVGARHSPPPGPLPEGEGERHSALERAHRSGTAARCSQFVPSFVGDESTITRWGRELFVVQALACLRGTRQVSRPHSSLKALSLPTSSRRIFQPVLCKTEKTLKIPRNPRFGVQTLCAPVSGERQYPLRFCPRSTTPRGSIRQNPP